MDPIIEPLDVIPTNLPTLTAGADPITEQYGNLWNGLTDADGQVDFAFSSDGQTDYIISFSGYDIDTEIELSVWVNGQLLAWAGTGVDNGLKSYQIVIPKEYLTGDDVISFVSNAPAYKWGVTDIAIEEYVTAPEPEMPTVTMDGGANTEQFGNLWNGLTDDDGVVSYKLVSDGATDLTLSFKGYDIDTDVELHVYLNGEFLGFAGAGVDNGLQDYSMEIDAALLSGDDTLTFVSNAPAYKWGVTDVQIDTSTGGPGDPPPPDPGLPEVIVGGATLTEQYGNLWNGLTDADGDVSYQFDYDGTQDLLLSFSGFDIDTDVELEILINGVSIGFSGAGVNEGLAAFEMQIDAGLLLATGNEITFRCSAPAYKWGVTDVRLDLYEAPPPPPPNPGDPVLVVGGDPITDQFGNLWNGMTDEDGKVSFTVETDGESDLILNFTGFDIDTGIELEVLVNGVSAGFSGQGIDEGLMDFTKIIDASLLGAGANTITFRSSAPEWKWGVTNVSISSFETPQTTGLVLDGPVDQQAYGNIWMDMSNLEGEVSFDIDADNSQDIELSFQGFDIDTDVELEVLVNGVSIGYSGIGLDNALSFHQLIISSDLLYSNGNSITFRSSAPEWKWGVTDIAIETAPATMTPADALWDQQWHMQMIGDIERIWADYDGTGIKVGIYDDGIDADHEDLAVNFRADWNVVTSDGTLDPTGGSGAHGTAVAGIISGEADNQGVIGIAYGSNFGMVDIFSGPADVNGTNMTVVEEAFMNIAFFDVSNHSWGAGSAEWFSTETRDFFDTVNAAYQYSAEVGRGGLGTVVVKAVGNDAVNANADLSNVSRHTVSVAALGEDDMAAGYTNWGTNVLVTAPTASGDFYGLGVVTTDLTDENGFVLGYAQGSYTGMDPFTGFSGTSSAAPVVSGVVALMLDAAPGLGWRDVQDILAYSATHSGLDVGETIDDIFFLLDLDSSVTDWGFNNADNWNGGGLHFSQAYGYGNVDVFNAVRMAEVWHLFTPEAQTSSSEMSFTEVAAGPHVVGASQSFTFDMSQAEMTVEVVEVSLALSDASVDVFLTSAAGTTMQLLFDGDAFGVLDWTFGVQGFRGEDLSGEWTLEIVNTGWDVTASDIQVEWFGSASTGDDDVYHYTDDIFTGMIWQDGNQTGTSLASDVSRTTLSDGAGVDWIDAAAMQGDTVLNLNVGATSSSGGLDFLTIATGTVIENAVTGDGDDVITGNAAGNELHGMRGDDTLEGGAGDDALYGGLGADLFVFSLGSGIDVIEDFEIGIDEVLLDGFGLTSFAELTFGSDLGGNATLDLGAGDILVFQSLGGETFLAEDFQFGMVVA